MSNENPADKESIGTDRDAQTETENEATGLDSIETTEVDGEAMVPLSQVKELVHDELTEFIDIQSDDDNPAVEDIWIAGQPFGKIINSNRETAKSAEEQARAARSSDAEPTGNDAENGSGDNEITTLERIADDDQDNPAGVRVTPSVTRAASVMKHWFDWSKKARKGRNIKGGLKKLIETATGESLAWRQVYRACKRVESLTKGKIVFFKHDRHGWMLLQPSSVTTG
jgi:hypothetical protein